ncbi:MAG: ferredoxin [Actinomycetia bacterium]|nr:ferredoxin [Actinomycetes bacterium]
MSTRKIIEIDRDLCDGCGLCTTACAEGALELDEEGKAVLARDIYCDGMGACLSVCPTGALAIVEREGAEYDAETARDHVTRTRGGEAAAAVHAGPSDQAAGDAEDRAAAGADGRAVGGVEERAAGDASSELKQWPIQLHLVGPRAPYFKGADLLIAADCTAFTRGSFHADLLRGRKMAIACPKLDDVGPYVEKLAELIRANDLKSLTVAVMTVPCCGGLLRLVERAVALSGVDIPVNTVVIDLDGRIVAKT